MRLGAAQRANPCDFVVTCEVCLSAGFVRDQAEFDLFHGFYEPDKADDFYPTYKKFERYGACPEACASSVWLVFSMGFTCSPNPPVDYSQPDWPDKCYRTLYKEPQYKGGKWKERVPGWCDRILLRHMQPHDRYAKPIVVLPHFNDRPQWTCLSPLFVGVRAAMTTQLSGIQHITYVARDSRKMKMSTETTPRTMTRGGRGKARMCCAVSSPGAALFLLFPVLCIFCFVGFDRYTSVNSGTAMVVSDHSPVRCSYNISVHGFNETPAQKITLSLSEIMMVEEVRNSCAISCSSTLCR